MPVQETVVDLQIQSALISAGAALLGSLIGAAASLLAVWLTKRVQASGKVSLYVKMVYSKNSPHNPWGFYRSQQKQGLFFRVPLWLDVVNTCGIPRVIRNFNLYAYREETEVAPFTQVQRIGDGENAIPLGDHESYSLVIPANSARRFDLEFILHEMDMPKGGKVFDQLILTYFDEKDCIHAFHFTAIDSCWVEGSLKMSKEWVKLNKRCSYAR